MLDIPQWLVVLIGSIVPITAFATFWMSISARLTKAETASETAQIKIKDACDKLNGLSKSYGDFRETVAKEYIHRSTMTEVEDRLTKAIDRLGDRFDNFLSRLTEK